MDIHSALIYLALGAIVAFQNPQTPVEPRPGRIVIDAVILDRAGMPVLDVKPSELEVWIAGYRIPIDAVTFVNPTEGVPSSRVIALSWDSRLPSARMCAIAIPLMVSAFATKSVR